MALPVLTLDTNVVVSALRSSRGASFRLMELVGDGYFDIGLTAPLVLEYESVCKRLVGTSLVTVKDVDILLNYLCQIGRRVPVHYRLRPAVPDPGDEMVLEAATASGSDRIVTHNVRELRAAAQRFGIEVLTPAETLHWLGVRR